MQLTIKYFGMLAEATTTNEEYLQTEVCSVSQLVKKLKNQYPKLDNTDFKVAIDQQLVDQSHIINSEVEVALLPPFAGG
ncbi:molybdopterin synthase sulfur carrier subunit [Aquimarina sp. EL_43]|uniref:MoaD/ThiS family protein n=1 Tax=Aquimarina TaxID=290174 RepID=UPI00046F0590|nr:MULTISPECIES: MoaD/ThiS family protein [Aquimarina]MBG6131816.1 molybdopterin synthase sulfur carrier subunit [Aquimarina sp. EL_35]MBG6149380.1 molybdopterin synthase sulfur carrier subunit [Aquimarina sp. EL_32]MBG6170357.1 molybdopterin synthase sulfur carrier subunit [Aquimarina sp. EL_43]